MTNQDKVIEQVKQERIRQNYKWGYPQDNSLTEWNSILTEEVGEVSKEINDIHFSGRDRLKELKEELIQVAAVAISIVEHLSQYDRG